MSDYCTEEGCMNVATTKEVVDVLLEQYDIVDDGVVVKTVAVCEEHKEDA